MPRIRFIAAHLLWSRGDVQDFSEPGATELVVSGIAEYVDEDGQPSVPAPPTPNERPAVSIAPAALPKKRTTQRTTRKR